MSQQLNKQEVLDALKKAGINNLEDLAQHAAGKAAQKDAQGNPIVMSWIVSPGFVINH